VFKVETIGGNSFAITSSTYFSLFTDNDLVLYISFDRLLRSGCGFTW